MEEGSWKQKGRDLAIVLAFGALVFTTVKYIAERKFKKLEATQATKEDDTVPKAIEILNGRYGPNLVEPAITIDYNSIKAEPNSDPNIGPYGYIDDSNKALIFYCWDGQYAKQGPWVIAQRGWGFYNLVTDPKLGNVAKQSLENALVDIKDGDTVVNEGELEPTLVAVPKPTNLDKLTRVNLKELYKLHEYERKLKPNGGL